MESPTAPQHLETSCPRSVRQGPSEAAAGWARGQLGETEAHGKEKGSLLSVFGASEGWVPSQG